MKGGYSLHLKATPKDFGATVYTLAMISEWKHNTRSCSRNLFKLGFSCFLNIQSTIILMLNSLLFIKSCSYTAGIELPVQF